jgi:hypothetical protein
MFLISAMAKCASLVLMTLFHKILQETCCAHGNNFYGYGGQVLKIWYLKPTKVHIVISI